MQTEFITQNTWVGEVKHSKSAIQDTNKTWNSVMEWGWAESSCLTRDCCIFHPYKDIRRNKMNSGGCVCLPEVGKR